MAAMELPTSTGKGGRLTFYTVDIATLALSGKVTTPVAPMDDLQWPYVTGMQYAGGNLYVSYEPMNPNTFTSDYADTSFVAVYSYPDFKFQTLMKDTRFGNIGSWNAFNGFQKDENGDLYAMSNTSTANGFSQSPKHCGFLKIKAGSHALAGSEVKLDLLRYVPLEEWVLEMEKTAFPPAEVPPGEASPSAMLMTQPGSNPA